MTERITLHQRKEHYRKDLAAYNTPINSKSRVDLCELADQLARDEIIDEIHEMLCQLTNTKD